MDNVRSLCWITALWRNLVPWAMHFYNIKYCISLSSLCLLPLLSPSFFALGLSTRLSPIVYFSLSLSVSLYPFPSLSFTCCLSLSPSPCLPSLSFLISVIVDKASLKHYSSVNIIIIQALGWWQVVTMMTSILSLLKAYFCCAKSSMLQ
jgi:hypothetical protein